MLESKYELKQTDLEADVRCAACNFIMEIITTNSKSIKKSKLTKELIKICLPIVVEEQDEDDDEDDEDEETPRDKALELLGKVENFVFFSQLKDKYSIFV